MTLKDGDLVYMPYVNPVHNETTSIDSLGNVRKSTKYSAPTCVATYIGGGRTDLITVDGHIPVMICEANVRFTDGKMDFINVGSARGLKDDELWMR